MLPKQRRINKNLFKDIFKQGYTFSTPFFTLKLLKKPKNEVFSAFSFVVSSKVAKLAVTRNLLKRRGKYAINKNIERIKDGFYCVFLVKKDFSAVKYSIIETEVLGVLGKAGLLK